MTRKQQLLILVILSLVTAVLAAGCTSQTASNQTASVSGVVA